MERRDLPRASGWELPRDLPRDLTRELKKSTAIGPAASLAGGALLIAAVVAAAVAAQDAPKVREGGGAAVAPAPPSKPTAAAALAPFNQPVKGSALGLDMVPVVPKDGSKPFFLAAREVSWDLYDTFVFGFDKEQGASTAESDAVTRPTKPYILMDRGFGHAGYPVISPSYLGAKRFCEWLSVKTGRTYRLPTLKEWQSACALAGLPTTKDELAEYAWFADNSAGKTHPLGTKRADALGLHDLYGNASEWVTGDEGKGVTVGGSFRDPIERLGCAVVVPYTPDWNASDPQYPKSKWWLADGGFVGFRVLCEP